MHAAAMQSTVAPVQAGIASRRASFSRGRAAPALLASPAPRRCPQLRGAVRTAAMAETAPPSPPHIDNINNSLRVEILSEALPYLQRFRGRTIVIKYGGAAMNNSTLQDKVISDVVLLSVMGIRPVLLHGGGPEINGWLKRLGIEPQFRDGFRVTDGPTMEVVEMVLTGKVNKSLVSMINKAGGSAMGLCGKDCKLIEARVADNGSFGFVGEVSKVDASVLRSLVADGHIPVVASVSADETGQALNINADIAAGEIAASLGAEKLILMTDVPGVLMDKNDVSTLVRTASISDIRTLIADGVIAGGMIPKVECCVRAVAQGVGAAHIIDGRQPHSLLLEILTQSGCGTMVTG